MVPSTKTSSSVYTLADPANGHVRYIGQAVDIKKRIGLHIFYAKRGYQRTYKEKWLHSLIQRGLLPIVEIIWEGDRELVSQKEREFITLFKSIGAKLTNGTAGGETTQGRKCKEETKQKFRELFTGKCLRPPISESERKALSLRCKGVKMPKQQIDNLKAQRKIGSDYWKKNVAAFENMRRFCERGKLLAKKIIATKDGISTIYLSTKEAESQTGCDRKGIRQVANGVYKQYKGYTFKFLANETI